MNLIVPLAGKDKNFEERGMIKPLTKVQGKEIIKWIAESRPFPYEEAIFIILKEHNDLYNFSGELKRLFGEKIKIIVLDEMTDGSPQSILIAENLINNEEELIIDLGDQYLDLTGFKEFIEKNKNSCDGIISTFESYYYNRGYMIINPEGFVEKVSEKDKPPISTHSTACISYFRKGSDFVNYAKQMIGRKKVAANGAYLPSLVYNEMIEDNKKIITVPCEFIAPLGTIQGADCFEQINRPFRWKNERQANSS
jgi:dTDP-glucose pyrophosphorylase